MKTEPTIHVWITKFALTTGVFECDAQVRGSISKRLIRTVDRSSLFRSPDWHTDLSSARARVREMITAKIESLRKSLVKMEELAQQYKD